VRPLPSGTPPESRAENEPKQARARSSHQPPRLKQNTSDAAETQENVDDQRNDVRINLPQFPSYT
jgi:hypothetical protein